MSNEHQHHPNQPDEKLPPLFSLGEVVITPGANEFLQTREMAPLDLVFRHVTGDFGDMDPEDLEANRQAIDQGSRVFSSYLLGETDKVWVITEWDRSVTTILLPSEY